LPVSLLAQFEINTNGIDNSRTDFVKNTLGFVQVLDSSIAYSYNGIDWDSLSKRCIHSRHWGTQGLPNEWYSYRYNLLTSVWDPYIYEHFTYFSDTAEVVDESLLKVYNPNILTWDPDSMQYYNYTGYVSKQFGNMLESIIIMNYDFNTYNYTGGMRYDITLKSDTLYDSYLYRQYNPLTGLWNNYVLISLDYDAANYMQKQLIQVWSEPDEAFINFAQNLYSFQNGNEMQRVEQTCSGGAWTNVSKFISEYTSGNKLSKKVELEWDNMNDVWLNKKQEIHTYTAGNETEFLQQVWNSGTTSWDNTDRNTYTYDANSNMLTNKYETWTGSAWQNVSRYTWTYNSNNQVTMELGEVWDFGSSSWGSNTKHTYVYDGNFNLTSHVYQVYDGGSFSWLNYDKYEYSYDSNSNKTLEISSFWNTVNDVWDFVDKTEFYYSAFDATSLSEATNGIIRAFPNPTNGSITIDQRNKDYERIFITDANGRVVLDKPMFETGNCINLKQYGSGLYNISLISHSGKMETTSVVVQ